MATEVRGRRDMWLATMLDKVRGAPKLHSTRRKCVAEMLLEDDQEGLSARM